MRPKTYLSATRKRILLALADGPEPASDIAIRVECDIPDTERKLAAMEEAGIVAQCDEGWRITAGKGAATFNRMWPDYYSIDLREAELAA